MGMTPGFAATTDSISSFVTSERSLPSPLRISSTSPSTPLVGVDVSEIAADIPMTTIATATAAVPMIDRRLIRRRPAGSLGSLDSGAPSWPRRSITASNSAT